MARNDLLIWLNQRLEITELTKRHPEILEQAIVAPMFIVGLPRSGTSILFEVLAHDPDVGVPKMWESLLPTPPPETATYLTDKRIEHAMNCLLSGIEWCPSLLPCTKWPVIYRLNAVNYGRQLYQ